MESTFATCCNLKDLKGEVPRFAHLRAEGHVLQAMSMTRFGTTPSNPSAAFCRKSATKIVYATPQVAWQNSWNKCSAVGGSLFEDRYKGQKPTHEPRCTQKNHWCRWNHLWARQYSFQTPCKKLLCRSLDSSRLPISVWLGYLGEIGKLTSQKAVSRFNQDNQETLRASWSKSWTKTTSHSISITVWQAAAWERERESYHCFSPRCWFNCAVFAAMWRECLLHRAHKVWVAWRQQVPTNSHWLCFTEMLASQALAKVSDENKATWAEDANLDTSDRFRFICIMLYFIDDTPGLRDNLLRKRQHHCIQWDLSIGKWPSLRERANHPSLWRNECPVTCKWLKEAQPTWRNIESMVWTSLDATFRCKLDPSFYSLMTKWKEKVEQSAEFCDTLSLWLKQITVNDSVRGNWRSNSTSLQFRQISILIGLAMCCQLAVTMAVRPGITEPDFKPLGKLKMPAPMRFFVRFILAGGVERQALDHANEEKDAAWRYIMTYLIYYKKKKR